MVLLDVIKKVVRCSVCARVHDLNELLDVKEFYNGRFTFTCPVNKTTGTYRIENVGTLHVKPAA